MKVTVLKSLCTFVIVLVASSSLAFADEAALISRLNGLEKTMTSMQRVIDRQNNKIANLEGLGSGGSVVASPSGEVPAWLNDLDFFGDLRIRYQAQSEHGATNAPDRNFFRYRLRFGMEKTWNGSPFHEDDVMKVGFRLGSSAAGGRTSTNTTFDTVFDYDAISINRAYATYLPGWAEYTNEEGLGLTGSEVTIGKFKNPFLQGSTWLMWDGDVEPEGIYEQFNFSLYNSDDLAVKNKTILGQMVLDEDARGGDHRDAELYAFQTIFESELNNVLEEGTVKVKNALSLYVWEDFGLDGNFVAAGNNAVAPGGTTILERSFNVVNIYNEIGLPVEVHKAKGFKFYSDWFLNLEGEGNDGAAAHDGYAWMLGAKLGKAKKKGTWELKYEYAWLGSDSSPDVVNDGDFGGTDRRGSVLRAGYAFTDSMVFKTALFRTDRINADDNERQLWQAELIWKF